MPYPDDPFDVRGSTEQLIRQAREHATQARREAACMTRSDFQAAKRKLKLSVDLERFAIRYELQLADLPNGARPTTRRAG